VAKLLRRWQTRRLNFVDLFECKDLSIILIWATQQIADDRSANNQQDGYQNSPVPRTP